MTPGSAEWRAFVLSETAATVREWRGAPVVEDDEVTKRRRRRELCEALDGGYTHDVEAAI
jgi:hypothetical protein